MVTFNLFNSSAASTHLVSGTKNSTRKFEKLDFSATYDKLSRTRLSKNFILRDFLFCAASAARGLSNFPEDPETVVKAGRALCELLLEPILAHFGRFAITFGYQSRDSMDIDLAKMSKSVQRCSSNPHQWDRGTFGKNVYARVDILPFCVEDGQVAKHEFGHWLMHNLDIDLCMSWTKSNGYCLTISPKPRRCWIQWGRPSLGELRQVCFMGTDYWQHVYPSLPTHERPKHAPSSTEGRMYWKSSKFNG